MSFKEGDRVRVNGSRFGRGFFTGTIVWVGDDKYQIRPDGPLLTTQMFYSNEMELIEKNEPEKTQTKSLMIFL